MPASAIFWAASADDVAVADGRRCSFRSSPFGGVADIRQTARRRGALSVGSDWLRFIGAWLKKPGLIGAVSPSGPALAQLMASGVDLSRNLPVLELGPGTGVVTRALLDRGVPANRLVLVEYHPDFCQLLTERFPGVHVIRGDAYDLAATLPASFAGPFAAVISSLPLMVKPPATRRALVEDALRRTAGGGPLIQFSYAFKAPVPAVPGVFGVTPSPWVFANVPPARVWTYLSA